MTLYEHHLTGCAPTPLAHYLKAIGILRLVSEQKDPGARGAWRDQHFVLWTTFDRAALECFFLNEYQPTPLFNPWGGRSGFYPDSSEKKARQTLEKIAGATQLVRLHPLHSAIKIVRAAIAARGGKKPEEREDKLALAREIRLHERTGGGAWLDALVVLGDELLTLPIMGTGGNEGSGSYTSNYMQAVVECLVDREWDAALPPCLFDSPSPSSGRGHQNMLQFDPEGSGVPWDFLFAIEALPWIRSSAVNLAQLHGAGPSGSARRTVSSPFSLPPWAAGYGTASRIDEYAVNKGRENAGRGEQWFPLWTRPASGTEISSLFAEGKATIGRRRANNAVRLARAISAHGTARGLSGFERYGYQQRNNLATHFAVPLGRFAVGTSEFTRDLLDERMDQWLERLHRKARNKLAPARLQVAERRLSDAVFDALRHPDEPLRWQGVLLASAGVEALIVPGGDPHAGLIPVLQPAWVDATDDGSSEFRLALALGTARIRIEKNRWSGIRGHFVPLDNKQRLATTAGLQPKVSAQPRVVLGGDPVEALLALVERRLVEGNFGATRHLDLQPARGAGAELADLCAFIDGSVDMKRILRLARAYAALRLRDRVKIHRPSRIWPDDAWLALRLAHLPEALPDRPAVPSDPAIIRRLRTGDAGAAFALARRRLAATGQMPPLRFAVTDISRARRWGAALAFPIDTGVAKDAAHRLFPSSKERSHAH